MTMKFKPLLVGWRFCSLWHLHHSALHSSKLVWNLLQVTYIHQVHNKCSNKKLRKNLELVWFLRYDWFTLYFVAFCCRMIQSSFIDMESMFKLFEEEEEVHEISALSSHCQCCIVFILCFLLRCSFLSSCRWRMRWMQETLCTKWDEWSLRMFISATLTGWSAFHFHFHSSIFVFY